MYQVIGSNYKETGNNKIPRMALMLQIAILPPGNNFHSS